MSKKGENIYKRKDGRWEARYKKGLAPTGGPQYGYCYGHTYREAKEKLIAAKAAVLAGEPQKTCGNVKKLETFCAEWLQLRRSKVKASTFVKYQTAIQRHILPELGGLKLSRLSTLTVENFAYRLLHEKGLSAKTVRDILTVLHAVLQYAEKNGCFKNFEMPYPKTEKQEMRVLTRDEQERFMQYLLHDTDRFKFGALLALLTGLRIGEICALRWQDVCLEEKFILVRTTMQRLKNLEPESSSKTKIVFSTPKSFSSARYVPLSPLAAALCCRFQAAENCFLLTGKSHTYVEPRTLQYRMERYVKECHLTGVHFHTLRHSFATRCVEVGFELKSLSEVLGHASPQITLERYVHSSKELKQQNMSKLAALGY